MGN
ncbi:Protein of unknown function [Bacillus cereus]|jgi:folate-binding protein YgfZ